MAYPKTVCYFLAMSTIGGKLLVNGELVEAESGARFECYNPANESLVGTAPDASHGDVYRAVAAARYAADSTDWHRDHDFRRHCLGQLQDLCTDFAGTWRHELVAEIGTPLMWTYSVQLDWPIAHGLGVPLKLMDTYEWEVDRGTSEGRGGKQRQAVLKHPVGVVSGIVPWNFPVEITLSKVGAVLATGNTMVIKAAPETPLNLLRLGELICETDIPPGVINTITSSDHLVGETLAGSADVDLVAFTGSTETGKRVMQTAAANMTRCFLELGGKSASIIVEDADLARAVGRSVSACTHAGQGCGLSTRLLLPRSRYAEALEIVREAWGAVPFGDPTDPEVMAGPLISARQRDRVLGYIDAGISDGARLLVGGGRPAGFEQGFFVEPTVFCDVDNSMAIAQEEIFGPVLCVIPYEDDDDAVRIANDSKYGLAGSVTGGDPARATAIARRIRTGTISVNGTGGYDPSMPFGGHEQSGIGRQWGVEGFDELMELTSISMPELE